MSYSMSKLTTPADCNSVLALSNKEKSDLEFKILSLTRNRNQYEERSTQITTDMTLVQGEISALTTVISTLPEGEVKDDTETKRTKLAYRLFTLEQQQENYGVLALLEKEMEIALCQKQLDELAVFQTALNARLAELN